jgi:hypothetical protein
MSILADKDIDTTMAADWAAIMDKHAVEPDEVEAPAVEPETPAAESVVDRGDGRRPDGKFAPKVKEIAPEKEPAARTEAKAPPKEGASPDPQAAAQPDQPIPERDVTRPPSTWKPTARAEWEKLPPTVKAEIHRRESDFMNGQSQLLPDAKFGKSVGEIVAPYRMLIESEGGTPERAIHDLLRTAAALRLGTQEQKAQTLLGVIKQYGVDLSRYLPQPGQIGQPPAQPGPVADPRVDQLIGQLNYERQQRAQQEQSQLEGTVTGWMNQQDAQGQPLRPYLGDVMSEMGALVPQIRQANPSLGHDQVLQQAYETATWGNPEIRQLLLQAQGTGQVRVADNQNRVRDARRAASVNVPRRASVPSAGKPGTLEETITNTARELGLIT